MIRIMRKFSLMQSGLHVTVLPYWPVTVDVTYICIL